MKSLLIGCGNSRIKKVCAAGHEAWRGELVTLDMDPNCGADIVMDMSWNRIYMPFGDAEFDELHAYDSLEHWGRQGDWKDYFTEMAEYHRILKPGGTFHILVPIGADAYADPGHCRFFSVNHFLMLSQQWYADSLAAGRAVTDYRFAWKLDFIVRYLAVQDDHHIVAILEKA